MSDLLELPSDHPFRPDRIQPVLVDSRVSAPGDYGWPAGSASTDGGGWWSWTLKGMTAWLPAHIRVLRAFAGLARGGRRVRVPVIDDYARVGMVVLPTPFDDGAGFDDGSLFAGGSVEATLVGAVALRADAAEIEITTGQALVGGEYFSLERPSGKGPELHMIMTAVDQGAGRFAVTVAPMFREAHPAGADCDFNAPAFVATVPDNAELWPEFDALWEGRVDVTFVEAP